MQSMLVVKDEQKKCVCFAVFSSACPELLLLALERRDYVLVQLCLQSFTDVPENVTCCCLKAFLRYTQTRRPRSTICPLSPILFVIFMDRRLSLGEESVWFGDLRIASLLFADGVVLLATSGRDLQYTLGRFAVECEAVGMRVSKSEAMVLCRNTVECSLQVGNELLPQAKEFKFLWVLFTRGQNGTGDGQTDWCGVWSNAGDIPVRCGLLVPTLAYCHELWVVTEITRSRIQAAKMSFLRRVAGLSLRDSVRSSDIRRELGVEQLIFRVERSQLRWFGHLIRMPPQAQGFSGHVRLRGDPEADPEPPGGIIYLIWLGTPRDLPGGARECLRMDGCPSICKISISKISMLP